MISSGKHFRKAATNWALTAFNTMKLSVGLPGENKNGHEANGRTNQSEGRSVTPDLLRDHLPEVLESIMAANMTTREAFDFAFGKEIEQREINRFKQALQSAHFPCIKRLEDFDFSAQPSIDPGTIQELAKLEWIGTGENVAFFGAPGVGKTHLALALGYKALEHNYLVRFYSAAALLSMLEKAAREDVLEARLKEINKYQLLIIDEIGYLPFSPAAAHLLSRW